MVTKNIYLIQDQRLPVIKKLLTSFGISKEDLSFSMAALFPDNLLILIVRNTVVYSCIVNEVINGSPLYIDCANTTFAAKASDPEDDKCQIIVDSNMINFINSIRNTYINNINLFKLIDHKEDLANDESFKPFTSLKSSQGAKFYKNIEPGKNYMVPFFTNFPKLTSSDNMELNIYDYDQLHQIVQMNIFKKKINRIFTITYRILKTF